MEPHRIDSDRCLAPAAWPDEVHHNHKRPDNGRVVDDIRVRTPSVFHLADPSIGEQPQVAPSRQGNRYRAVAADPAVLAFEECVQVRGCATSTISVAARARSDCSYSTWLAKSWLPRNSKAWATAFLK